MHPCAVIPALDAERTLGDLVTRALGQVSTVIVVDDGSNDATAAVALAAGAIVTRHPEALELGQNKPNQGKGAALKRGFALAQNLGHDVAVTLDADGQHLPEEIGILLAASPDPGALVLGVRDLAAADAPVANQRSNAFANGFLSMVTARRLRDTQCGMRRYPLAATLRLSVRDDGFAFETEVLLRALRQGIPLVQVPISVRYPADRTTHFDPRTDPWRIVARVLRTLSERRF